MSKIGGGLIADYENGEGEVKISDEFSAQNNLLRMDILQDWLGEIENLYKSACDEWKDDFERMRRNANPDIH